MLLRSGVTIRAKANQGVWRKLRYIGVWGGWAFVAILVWAFVTRLNLWQAWHYVSLVYLATMLTGAGAVGGLKSRAPVGHGGRSLLSRLTTRLQWPLFAVIVLGQLYLRSEAFRAGFGWLQRQLYLLQFH